MSDIAIRIENLSKRYRINMHREKSKYRTLREAITDAATLPVRAFRRRSGRAAESLYDYIWALDDITLEVKRGEVVGIIGRNGAGKSTLLKVLSRITEPSLGYVEIHGRVGSLLEVGTGFHLELTGRENIMLNGSILGMKRREIERNFDEIVAFAEVERFIDTPVKHYSSGMHLRLAFSVAAHLEPEILLVDEVLAVGDIAFQKKCLGKMEDVAAKGRTVLFVSHNLAAVKELCQTGVVLTNGKLDFLGPVVQGLVHYSRSVTSPAMDRDGRMAGGLGHVSINGQNGGLPKPVPTGEAFYVEASLQIGEELTRTKLYLLVDDSNGNGVVHHRIELDGPEFKHLKPGCYKVRAEIPPLWLMPDAYSLYLKAIGRTGSGSQERYESERVVLDVRDQSGQSVGKVRAVMIPPVKWSVEPGQ